MKQVNHKPVIYFLPSPKIDPILKKYFQKLGFPSQKFWKKLNPSWLKKMFLLALKDFEEKKISLEQFSTISWHLHYNGKVWGPLEINRLDFELESMLEQAEELVYFYYKHKKERDKKALKEYKINLKTLKNYLQKNE